MTRNVEPPSELAIRQRLRVARERLGLTHKECADQLGIPRTTLINYECGRARLQCGIALLFCRQFIISEEWLATGAYEALRAAAKEKGLSGTEIFEQELAFFFRQCVDLHSECAAQGIAVRGSLGDIYPHVLAPIYRRLAVQFFHQPLVTFRDTDSPKLVQNYVNVLLARWLRLLDNESAARQVAPGLVRRTMLRCLFEAGTVIFARMIGRATPEVASSPAFAWLRTLVASPDVPIGPLYGLNTGAGQGSENISEKDLKEQAVKLDTTDMKSAMPKLLERLRKATAERGRKSELAAWLGVHPQCVTDWLTGRKEPGGETTLRLLHWAELQERKP